MSISGGILTAVVLTSAVLQQLPNGSYSDQMFREAVDNRQNTAQPFVLVTIIDASTGQEKEGCTGIGGLAAAIALQKGWTTENPKPSDDELDQLLLKATDRRFTFYDQRWLVGSGYYSIESNQRVCLLLRRGIPAFRADITGKVYAGTPQHPLTTIPLQNDQ